MGWLLAAALLSAATAACGSSVETVDDDGAGGSGASGGNGGNGGSGAKGGECSAFLDEEAPGTVTVRVVNQSPLDLYVPALCDLPAYQIAPESGPQDLLYVFGTSCLYTCEMAQTQEMFGCPAAACAQTTHRVAAGSSLELTWPGTALDQGADMPDACYFDAQFAGTCSQIVAAPAGTYQAFVQGFMECNSYGPEPCDCDDNGLCFGEASGLEGYPEPASFEFPADDEVEIVFGPCAFGCAQPG